MPKGEAQGSCILWLSSWSTPEPEMSSRPIQDGSWLQALVESHHGAVLLHLSKGCTRSPSHEFFPLFIYLLCLFLSRATRYDLG